MYHSLSLENNIVTTKMKFSVCTIQYIKYPYASHHLRSAISNHFFGAIFHVKMQLEVAQH